MNTNQALVEMYKRNLPGLRNALNGTNAVGKKISYPLLSQVFAEYGEASKKVFVVGQQTLGWGSHYWGAAPWHNDDAVLIERLIKAYNGFHLGRSYYRSPFWSTAHGIHRRVNPSSPEFGFVWSNLIKVDQDGNCPDSAIWKAVCDSFPVLPSEIKMTEPDVVIFFSGPNYDDALDKTFSGAHLQAIPGYSARILCRVIHKDLPDRSFRTYHPKYLRMSGMLTQIVDKIVSLA